MTEQEQILKLGEAVFTLSESLRLFEEVVEYENIPQDVYDKWLYLRDYIETEADVKHGINDRKLFAIGYQSYLDMIL